MKMYENFFLCKKRLHERSLFDMNWRKTHNKAIIQQVVRNGVLLNICVLPKK